MNESPQPQSPATREYRRYWHWGIWSIAALYGAMTLVEITFEGVPLRNGLRLVFTAFLVWQGVVIRRDSLRLSDTHIWVRQPRSRAEPRVALADLEAVRWENPGAICFETIAGSPYVVSLSGLRSSLRREIRDHLRARVPAYGKPGSDFVAERLDPTQRVEG